MLRRVIAAIAAFSSFAADRRGQVAITFGLAMGTALVLIGSVVDYTRAVTQRSNLQQATDATVLAMAHSYLGSSSTCQNMFPETQTYLTGTMNSPGISTVSVTANGASCSAKTAPDAANGATLQQITFSQNQTVMCIKTAMAVPTMLMTIANIKSMTVSTTSCAQIGGTYEVALALDNSYSMSESLGSETKMSALKRAAKGLVTALIPTGTDSPASAISIVPFNALVNVGTDRTAKFIDTQGQSSLNWQDISKPTYGASPPSRFNFFDTMNVAWAGCVEERPDNRNDTTGIPPNQNNYLTTDVAASKSDGESLFVPYFAPDDPGGLSGTKVNLYGIDDYYCGDDGTSGSGTCGSVKNKKTFMNSYLADTGAKNPPSACTVSDIANDNKATNVYPGGGMTLACKYKGATPTINNNQWFGLSVGPNSNCTTPAITPLTTDQTVLTNAINAMQPEGLTSLGTGFMWAWRTISPNVNPYPVAKPQTIGQQNPKTYGYSPPKNTKVIILMTDGYNTWSPIITTYAGQGGNTIGVTNPFLSSYEAFGFMTDNRLSNYSGSSCPSGSSTPNMSSNVVTGLSNFRCQMDNMLLEACQNAKATNPGVIIYTVGFSTSQSPIDQAGINVLKGCATSPSNYFQAANGDQIVTVFQQIAAAILNLRISM